MEPRGRLAAFCLARVVKTGDGRQRGSMASGSSMGQEPVRVEDWRDAWEQEKVRGESYLQGIADYMKWTTTLAGAALLWVGNALVGLSSVSRVVAGVGLILLSTSLATAVFAAFYVLRALGNEWMWTKEWHQFTLFDQARALVPDNAPHKAVEEIERARLDQWHQALDAAGKASASKDPAVFRWWVVSHVGLLVGGLCAYVLAQLLALR